MTPEARERWARRLKGERVPDPNLPMPLRLPVDRPERFRCSVGEHVAVGDEVMRVIDVEPGALVVVRGNHERVRLIGW